MKPHTVLLLVVVCAAVGVGAWWALRPKAPDSMPAGTVVFPGFPVNDVTKVVVSDPRGCAVIEKKGTFWVVPARYSYRADYARVRDLLVTVMDMKVTQKRLVRPTSMGKMKLLGPEDANAPSNQYGTTISFYNQAGTRIAQFIVGVEQADSDTADSDRFNQPQAPKGRFIRVPARGDAVISVTDSFPLQTSDDEWMDCVLANVANDGIRSVTVTPPSGTVYRIERKARGAEFEIAGLNPTQQIDSAAASSLGSTLSYLSAVTVVPPAVAATNTALAAPWTLVCKTFDGPVYTLTVSDVRPLPAYLKMAVAYEKPASTNDPAMVRQFEIEDSAKRLNEQVSSWLYEISVAKVSEMRKTRAMLIEAKSADTNTPTTKTETSPDP